MKIIGSGVNGLTTGICLNLFGYDTEIVTEKMPLENGKDPKVATEYAPASVKPSTIKNEQKDTLELFNKSKRVFKYFEDREFYKTIPHFLGSDSEYSDKYYSDNMIRSESFEDFDDTIPSSNIISDGEVLKIQFINMPEYIPFLVRKYRETGGSIRKKKVDQLSNLNNNDKEIAVNCAGYGSKDITEDRSLVGYKGYLLYVFSDDDYYNRNPVSYSYDIEGKSVYCYPHRDKLILGGTAMDESEENIESYYTPSQGCKVPRHIYESNKRILEEYINIDFSSVEMKGVYGYRPYRRRDLRISKSGSIIHNYGHGGSGVTLSWGSGLRVLNLVENSSLDVQDIINRL